LISKAELYAELFQYSAEVKDGL